jgi:predicted dehydrogenase
MALSYEDCLTMIAKSKEKNIPLWVGYYRRALPRFKKIKEIVDSGQIGDVRSVRVNLYKHIVTDPENIAWRFMPEISGGGIFVDMGSHTLDFLDYVLGPINEAHGIAVNQLDDYPAEDNVSAVFRFANGAIGTGNWCFSTEHELDQTELIGTKGSVAFASFSVRPIELTVNGETSLIKIPDPEHVHQPLVETILSEIGGTGICPSSGVSAARTNWVVDQILKNNSNA